MSTWLPKETFVTVIDATPLVSIDLVVRDEDGQVLLGCRLNRPAQGFWFVPGGRVRKNELLDDAFRRLTYEELGIEMTRDQARFLGVYQHLYDDNALNAPEVSTHYVVLGYEVKIGGDERSAHADLNAQHSKQRWWQESDLLNSPDVHANTKAYFDPSYCV